MKVEFSQLFVTGKVQWRRITYRDFCPPQSGSPQVLGWFLPYPTRLQPPAGAGSFFGQNNAGAARYSLIRCSPSFNGRPRFSWVHGTLRSRSSARRRATFVAGIEDFQPCPRSLVYVKLPGFDHRYGCAQEEASVPFHKSLRRAERSGCQQDDSRASRGRERRGRHFHTRPATLTPAGQEHGRLLSGGFLRLQSRLDGGPAGGLGICSKPGVHGPTETGLR